MCIAAAGAFNDMRFDMHTRLCTSVLAIIAATALTACNRTDSGTTPGAGTGTSSSSGTGATAGAGTGSTSSSSTATGPGASASAASAAR
jgi:hypothetical protein